MSAARRRLSSGSGMLKLCEDENSDDDDMTVTSVGIQEKSIYTFPKKANARRRSSFGGPNSSKNPINAAEQARIAEMYKTVIQMSSENKLNEKNSWNYDLIDHMGNLIKDDSRGVNFQKASCTLDASVKIYSNRVDDTYSSSHRILESLSRNGTVAEEPADEDHDADEGEGGGGGRKKGKTSARLNIATTIERNVSALNAVKLENDVAVDPMFHKISKAFDEGGAKGMLMNNLRVSSTGSSLSFHFTDLAAPSITTSSTTEPTSNTIDLADLLKRSELTVAGLSTQSVCPALNMYRDQICLPLEETLLSNLSEVLTSTAMHAFPTAAAGDDVTHTSAVEVGASAGINDDLDGFDDDQGAGMYFDDVDDYEAQGPAASGDRASAPFPTNVSTIGDSPAGSVGEFKKLRWEDNDEASDPVRSAAMAADMEILAQGLENITISNTGPSEYSYFDSNAVFGSSNAWAGARHWKYATRKRTAVASKQEPVDADATGDQEVEGETGLASARKGKKPRKVAGKKGDKPSPTAAIDFTLDLVDESAFDFPKAKSKADPTTMSDATVTKQISGADTLFLPCDAKVQVKDLCKLYLAPLVMIPANNQQRAALAQCAAAAKQRSGSSKIDKFLGGQYGSERVWGLSAPSSVQTATRAPMTAGSAGAEGGYREQLNGSFVDDGDDGYGGDYGGGDDDFYEGNNQENMGPSVGNVLPPALNGLGINEGGLLQADRKVEKIEIGYAKVSKRVNIQRLKTDIWSNIRTAMPSVENDIENAGFTPAGATEKAPSTALSFQNMIAELAEGDEVRQKDVTLPFYFICLLHLANEHNLKIEDREDMSDLIVTPGMK